MKNSGPNMADIAKALGISAISVSRALSGQEGVGEELRARVLGKAEEMGYLRQHSMDSAKILVLHQKPYLQDNSNFARIIQDMEKALQTGGCVYDMEFVDKPGQLQLRLPQKLQGCGRYSGLITIGGFEKKYIDFLCGRVQACVCFGGYSPAKNRDSVWYDFASAGYSACDRLIAGGHRKIGYLGSGNGYASRNKALGVKMALEEYGLAADEKQFCFSEEEFRQNILEPVKAGAGPTAFVCLWDYNAVKLIRLLHENGVEVPRDVSVIGQGNTELSALCIPALTTLELHIDYACTAAVQLIRKRIADPFKPVETVLIGTTPVERDSVRPVGKDD